MKADAIIKASVSKDVDEEYDFDASAEEIAKSRGQIVVWPEENELQLDIDSAAQWRVFMERFEHLGWDYGWTRVHKSKRGPNRFHVYIRVPNKIYNDDARLILQAMLNDDPVRIWLNGRRWEQGVVSPSRLFENPGFDVNTGIQVNFVAIMPEVAIPIEECFKA